MTLGLFRHLTKGRFEKKGSYEKSYHKHFVSWLTLLNVAFSSGPDLRHGSFWHVKQIFAFLQPIQTRFTPDGENKAENYVKSFVDDEHFAR